MSVSSRLDDIAVSLSCPFCLAVPGMWCQNRKTRRRAWYLHAARSSPVWEAYRIGSRAGAGQAVQNLTGDEPRVVEWRERFGDRYVERVLAELAEVES